MQQPRYLPVFSAMVLLTSLPAAAMTITMSPQPPPPAELILAYDAAGEAGSYLCSHGSGTVADLGQTFRAARAGTLEKITLKGRAATAQTPGELVTLILGTFTDPADSGMDELLAAETRILPPALPVGEVFYLTFDFADLPLEAGRQYGFQLGFTGGGNVNNARLELLHVGADAYPEGQAVETAGANPSALANDLAFFLHGTTQVAGDALLLGDGRFQVAATWRDFQGQVGVARPVPLTDATGYFWFFDPDNVEMVVKVLDACSLEGYEHFWVFAAGLTNVEVTMTVTDTLAGEDKVYVNRMGEALEPILDTAAFATCNLE